MEMLSQQCIAGQNLRNFVIKTFAEKMSTVEVSFLFGKFTIDHKDAVFIKPMEDYEMVINTPDKFEDSFVEANNAMLKGYIEKIKEGHLHIFRNSRSAIEKAELKLIEVKIKGKLSFTISEQELNKAFRVSKDHLNE